MGVPDKINNRMANGVDSVEMAHYELFCVDLPGLQKYLFWSTGLNVLKCKAKFVADNILIFFYFLWKIK